ncbi:hypothetical protein MWH25_01850 [Natroniella acetigena]|uniref:hypothetical protein n=1 Tax=Natroniella acetigena TaxID=52004 RepID=UPI00200B26A2|nr:hypothetical protein [Natroniella acetigena]MCK8826493.1 hypothetical protein [Natroniella acetigena]
MKKIYFSVFLLILLLIVAYQTGFFNKRVVNEQISLNAGEYSLYDFELEEKKDVKISCQRLEGAVVEWLVVKQGYLKKDLFVGDIIDDLQFRDYGFFTSTEEQQVQRFTLKPGKYTIILNNTKHGEIYPSDFAQQDSIVKVRVEIIKNP